MERGTINKLVPRDRAGEKKDPWDKDTSSDEVTGMLVLNSNQTLALGPFIVYKPCLFRGAEVAQW